MKLITLSKPNLGLIAITRVVLGAGIGLLLGEKLSLEQRRAVGWALVAVGVITTFPLIAQVLASSSVCAKTEE
jgi:hypothetical protein